MQALKAMTSKWTGKGSDALMGDSLLELMRQATAKTLQAPDITTNQLVCEKINDEVVMGKNPKEIGLMIKDRLRLSNPHKQWLALKLLEVILENCRDTIGFLQPDLLQEVARVMYEPSKPETEEGKKVRFTAKELLKKYGQAGTNAFRAVHANNQTASGMFMGGFGPADAALYGAPAPGQGPPPGQYLSSQSFAPPSSGYPQAADNGSGPRGQLQDEVRQLIDKSKSNAELLSDMLLNASGSTDDFESDLIKDLLTQCREMREILNGYLEKLAVQPGEVMEKLLAQTLEAADSLDCALSLQKDIHLGLAAERAATPYSTPAPPPPAPIGQAASSSTYQAAPAAPPSKVNNDLIALDDLFGSMAVQQPPPPQQSFGAPLPPQPYYGAPAAAAPSYGMADPFAASFGTVHGAFAAPPQPYGAAPPPYGAPPPVAQALPPSPPRPAAAAMADPFASLSPLPPTTYTPPPPMVAAGAPAPGYTASAFPDQSPYASAAPKADPFATGTFNSVPYNNAVFDSAPSGGIPTYSSGIPLAPQPQPQPQQPSLSANNPFASSNLFVPQQSNPFGQPQAPPPAYNPQQQPVSQPAAAVDQEWAQFFNQPRQ